jgi:hypothetical protein
MKDLNITYYFGQLREEYRGENALFMEIDTKGTLKFKTIPLNSEDLRLYTGGLHSPMRTYIGVTPDAQQKLEERLRKRNLRSAFELDVQIVREEIVRRRVEEISDLERASLSAAIATGK